jgi:heme A synthase
MEPASHQGRVEGLGPSDPRRGDRGAVLTLAFATTVTMWAMGYVGRLPLADGVGWAPPWSLFAAFVICLLVGGYLTGARTGLGAAGGARVGGLAALLNLLILGSFLAQEAAPAAAIYVPAWLVLGAGLGALGAAAGGVRRVPAAAPRNWVGAFAWVAVGATLLLLAVGGLVTSHEVGLSVPDWPNTYRSNMFLYPLSRMTGGIYYEHTHRLFGSLVGLTTIALAVQLWRLEPRGWVRGLGLAAVPLVVLQGLLGGLRVTGPQLTFSTEAADLAPKIELAIAHGVLAQLFFSLLVLIAVATSRAWREAPPPRREESAESDLLLTAWLVPVVAGQLVLGALLRHLDWGLMFHITGAVAVVGLGLFAGVRAWLVYPDRALNRLGAALAVLVGLQLGLGFGALVFTRMVANAGSHPLDVPLATAHQTVGAVILGLAMGLAAWERRLLEPVPEEDDEPMQPAEPAEPAAQPAEPASPNPS